LVILEFFRGFFIAFRRFGESTTVFSELIIPPISAFVKGAESNPRLLHPAEALTKRGQDFCLAKTWVNPGAVYRQKGEWDRAIEMYERSRETFERMEDAHGYGTDVVQPGASL
jgi:hypothetical protein